MAKIPLAEGQQQITRQPLASRAQPGIFSTEIAKATQEFARTVADTAQRFEDIQTLAEKTNATTKSLRELKELNLEAESANSIEDIAKFRSDYPNRINKIREGASKAITLPQAKNEFGRSFDRDKTLFDFSIRSTLKNNQNLALGNILTENIAEQRDIYINNPVMRQAAEASRDLLLSEAVNRGTLNIKEAKVVKDSARKEWRLSKIDADIERDAEQALADLKEGDKGIYAETDAGDRLTKETRATTKLARNEKIAKKVTNERHTKTELDLTQKFFTNQLDFSEIQGQFIENNISQKYAGILNTVLTSPKAIDAKTDDVTKGKLITEYLNLDESNLDNLRKFRVKTLGFHGAGLLSRNDAQFLFNKTVDPFTQEKKEGKGFLASAVESIVKWAEGSPVLETPGDMIDKLFARVDEKAAEENIVKASQDIITEKERELYPGYDVDDLRFTAKELSLSIGQVFEMLSKRDSTEE